MGASRRFGVFGYGGLITLALAAGCGSSSDTAPEDPTATSGAGGSSAGVGAGATAGAYVGGNGGTGGSGDGSGGTLIGLAGSGDGGALDPDAGCATATAEATLVPTNFLFVIDVSGSMNCNPPDGDALLASRCARFPVKEDPARPSKWEVTRAALVNALGRLVEQPQVSAGLMLFPRATECGVSAEPDVPVAALDAAHFESIQTALNETQPDGETPVAGATILSYAHLAKRLVEGSLSGNSLVILLTDGMETCAPAVLAPLLEKDVPNARGFDIRTFVIGAPGSEPARSLLSEIAWQGGTAESADCSHGSADKEEGGCHFDMTASADFEAELGATLEEIGRTEAISCELAVPRNPDGGGVDLERVNVTFTPSGAPAESIGNDKSPCSAANGWQYSEDSTRIVLCGSACSRVRSNQGELKIVLGCPTEDVR